MIRFRLLLLVLFSLACVQVQADLVFPSDRVETRLRVRAAPDGQAAVVGHLVSGESAEYRGTVPYWYKVALDDGTPGFVSKAWSRLVPDSTAELLRLGAWNVKKLGHGTRKDVPLVAQIIDANFDIVAVVEVMQKGGAHPGYDALVAALGSGWAGLVTSEPRPKTSAGHAEYYAVVYRSNRLQPCNGWPGLVYHADNDGSGSDAGPDIFAREPAYICFAVTLNGGLTGFDFLLAAYHARWAEGDIEDIQNEVRHVEDVFQSMSAARPGEGDLLVIGDFNLVPSDLDAAISREVPTSGTGSTLNGSGERTGNLYDHLVVGDPAATTELVGSVEVLDVRGVAADNRTFFRTVSDHLPIMARFRVGPDDD